MPLFDYECTDCRTISEILLYGGDENPVCPACGSRNMEKKMSAHSAVSGAPKFGVPGPKDTTCCGSAPGHGSCAGPGSCCGRNH